MSGKRTVGSLALVVVAVSVAFAPGARAQDDRGMGQRPDRRGGFAGRSPRIRPGEEPPAPMQVAEGKLYIVTGSTVRKLDADTLEEESTAVIPMPTADIERETKRKEKFMERFDKDGDGFVREDEIPTPTMIERLDRDADGAISISEVPSPRRMREPTGPVTLLVEGGDLYIYRAGWLYRFGTADLVLEAQKEIAPQAAPERPRVRKNKVDRKRKRHWGGQQDDEPEAPPPPPEPPKEPVRF